MSNDSKKSNGWKYWIVVVGLLLMIIAYFVHDRNKVAKQRDAAKEEANDFFNMARNDGLFRLSELAKQDSVIFAYKDSLNDCRNEH